MTPNNKLPRGRRQLDPLAAFLGRLLVLTILAVPIIAAWAWLIRDVLLPFFGGGCQ